MKIDLQTLDLNSFYKKEIEFCGQTAYLVTPKEMGCDWTRDNIIFRSSIWSTAGELLSASFKKFCNWGERPEIFPVPTDLTNSVITDKLDGSCLICDYINDVHNFRTRGTANAISMPNGNEIEIIKQKYPKLLKYMVNNPDYTVLLEWLSSSNVIVIRYEDCPDVRLIGIVDKLNYTYLTQDRLDAVAEVIGVKRPDVYRFDSIDEMLKSVSSLQGREGVCVYHNNGQSIVKAKAEDYLRLHRMKADMASLKRVAEVYFAQETMMTYEQADKI
jgi:hypothetical protein